MVSKHDRKRKGSYASKPSTKKTNQSEEDSDVSPKAANEKAKPLRFRLRRRKYAEEKSRDTSERNSIENSQDHPNSW